MDVLPQEIRKKILGALDDTSRRAARLASKEWFKIIHYDSFVFYGKDLATFSDIVSRLATYEHQIGINIQKYYFKSDYQKILALSTLTHLTKIDAGYQNIILSQSEWMHLSTLTNLLNFSFHNANYPQELLLNYSKLTKLKVARDETPGHISEVLGVMSHLRELTMPSSALALVHHLPRPIRLLSLEVRYDNSFAAVEPDPSNALPPLQNVTKLLFWARETSLPLCLPNLEYLDCYCAAVSRLEESTKLTSLSLCTTHQPFDEVVPQLAALTQLKDLFAYIPAAKPQLLEFLTALTALESLNISTTESEPIGSALWAYLNAPNLTRLYSTATLTMNCTAEISRLTNLVALRIERGSDRHHLSHLTTLQSLQLDKCISADDSYISRLTRLKSLRLESEGVCDLDQLNLVDLAHNLERLELSMGVTTALYDSIASLTNLTFLSLSQSPADGTPNLLKSMTKLQFLYTKPQHSAEFYSVLALATNLRDLQLRDVRNEDHLNHLTTLSKLTQVMLIGNIQEKTTRGIFALATNLVEFDISFRPVMSE